MSSLHWLDLKSLSGAERTLADECLGGIAPIGVSRGRTFHDVLSTAEVTGANYYNLDRKFDRMSWGVIATTNAGAIVVGAEVVKAARLLPLPNDLGQLAVDVGPTTDALIRATRIAERHPGDADRQSALIAAALEHAELYRRLHCWRPGISAA